MGTLYLNVSFRDCCCASALAVLLSLLYLLQWQNIVEKKACYNGSGGTKDAVFVIWLLWQQTEGEIDNSGCCVTRPIPGTMHVFMQYTYQTKKWVNFIYMD